MQVDTASVLRILAHELRSPAGVAQGYVKMVLDGRLSNAADQQRALEQTRDALVRIGALSREASDVASWLERSSSTPWRTVPLRGLVETIVDRIGRDRLDASVDALDGSVVVQTLDESTLTMALTAMVSATVRERPQAVTSLAVHLPGAASQARLAIGPASDTTDLLAGPSASENGPIPLERGGLGLSLVLAVLVVEAHQGTVWTCRNRRDALGISLPIVMEQTS